MFHVGNGGIHLHYALDKDTDIHIDINQNKIEMFA